MSNHSQRQYIIGVFGVPSSQKIITAPDYITAYKAAKTAFPKECCFAVSADAINIVSKQPERRSTSRRQKRP